MASGLSQGEDMHMTRRKEAEIIKNWPENSGTPLVTVIAICYCHEKYLSAALDSVLAQETNFSFEIVVHDDFSPDKSAAIIREYARAYPRLIRPVLEEENQFSKGTHAFFQAIIPYIRGKYLAYLDCDDYWTDVNKLQEQVDFLEAHPTYLAAAHNCTMIDADGVPTGAQYPECKEEEYTIAHYLDDTLPGQASTLLIRNTFMKAMRDHHLIMNAPPGPLDRVFFLTLLYNGRIHCIQKSMSAYRYVTEGGTSFTANYRFKIRRDARYYLSLILFCKRMGRTGDAIGMLRWFIGFTEYHKSIGSVGDEETAPFLDFCRTSISSLTDQLMCSYKRCACCGQLVRYVPMPIDQQEMALSIDGLFMPETLNPDAYMCPNCGSLNTERLMTAALERLKLSEKTRDFHILQIAPSHALDAWIRANCPGAAYETCDLCMEGTGFCADDVPDESYDLILCSHVLERVRDDRRTLAELKRILREDGLILLLVPVDRAFSGTDEDWGLSAGENLRRFGQKDSCRRYSREGLLSRLKEHFFVQTPGREFFGEDCFRQAGLPDSGTLYVLARSDRAALLFDAAAGKQAPLLLPLESATLVVYFQQPGDTYYTEEKSVYISVPKVRNYGCRVPLSTFGELIRLRIDPMEHSCFIQEINVTLETEDGEEISVPIRESNGLACCDGLVFISDDPQIEADIRQGKYRAVTFSCKLISCEDEDTACLYNFSGALSRAETEISGLQEEISRSKADIENLTEQLAAARRDYDVISNAAFWKITKPARDALDLIKKKL